jgi:hypothetical protein
MLKLTCKNRYLSYSGIICYSLHPTYLPRYLPTYNTTYLRTEKPPPIIIKHHHHRDPTYNPCFNSWLKALNGGLALLAFA